MIEPRDDGIDRPLQVGEVDEPARRRVDLSAHGDLAPERVAMHTPALVSIGHIRKEVRGFEPEVFDEIDRFLRHRYRRF